MASEAVASERGWLGHPKGLATLFMTEMWERFSYYGMRALLILYMVAPVEKGGLGFVTQHATSIYGWYTSMVYFMSLPGGYIADKWLGQYRAVLLGGIIIACGHFAMAVDNIQLFYAGLCLIVIGTGLLKPNVSSMVGSLYKQDDPRRDSGFSIFYMGINIGAFIAPLICGYLGQKINWHWGFGAAGVGMTIGLIQYVLGRAPLQAADSSAVSTVGKVAAIQDSVETKEKFTPAEWKRIAVIGILFVFAILFWSAFEQAGSSLNLFADRMTRLSLLGWEFPSSWFQSVQPLFIIVMAGAFSWIWVALGKHEPSSPGKFAYGLVFVGLGFLLLVPASTIAQQNGIRVSPMWLIGVYFLHTVGELALSPVGLSMVTKLAPRRIVGLMMGVWFLSISLGNKIGGWIAGFFDKFPLPTLFGTVAAITIGAGVILALFTRPIRKLMGGVH